MTDKEIELALETIALVLEDLKKTQEKQQATITAIKEALKEHAMQEVQRLGQEIEQEPVMILPDGSAFGVMSFPLPDDHWLYAPNEYKDGEYEPIDLPKPILTHELRDAVVAAVRYAVRGATMRGQETDFDPDALVQNAVYALCGPYATPPKPKPEQEPVAWLSTDSIGERHLCFDKPLDNDPVQPLYTSPPQRKPLTDEQIFACENSVPDEIVSDRDWCIYFARAIEAKLKEKNT